MRSLVTMKTESGVIDGTPEKRVFWSIIADYGLDTGVCELVDNALDYWMKAGRKRNLNIGIELDAKRQLIVVEDNAGGVSEADLHYLIAPGGSQNQPLDEIIGVFGVGSKRASVAIGEHVEIKTRYRSGDTFELDVTKDWLATSDWSLPSYKVPNLSPNTTRVEITKLRRVLEDDDITSMKQHLAETYSWFIENGCSISVNGVGIPAITFDKFAFPPDYPPQKTDFELPFDSGGVVRVQMRAGLITDRVAESDNYGVYFYCNRRLIVKELKTRDVGYLVSGEAGVPHPDASLARTIIKLEGPARAMPWNSSKSDVDTNNPLFQQIRPSIIRLNGYFSSLSRRLKANWPGEVFKYKHGNFAEAEPPQPGQQPRFVMAELPRVNKAHVEHLRDRNKKIIKDKPWTLGLVEAMAAVDVLLKQRFDTKNRLALILIDSNFEIAIKEFIVHETGLFSPATYTDTYIANLFKNRTNVINAVKNAVPQITADQIAKSKHFYLLRNKLIHERATSTVTDNDVTSYRLTVEGVLKTLFNLRLP